MELTLGQYTHAGLFDLSSAVNALPPLPLKDAPKTERAVMQSTGADDFAGPITGQTADSDRQHLRVAESTESTSSLNVTPVCDQSFEQHRQHMSNTEKRRDRDSNPGYPYGHAGFQDRCAMTVTDAFINSCETANIVVALMVAASPGRKICNVSFRFGNNFQTSCGRRSINCVTPRNKVPQADPCGLRMGG